MIKKLILCILFIFLITPTLKAVRLLKDTYTISVVANGKDFFSTYLTVTVDGNKYPFYIHERDGEPALSGISFGQIATELINVEGIDQELADRLGIDSFTTYSDLGITLFEMDDPFETDNVYLRLKKESAVKYLEISLIEADIFNN